MKIKSVLIGIFIFLLVADARSQFNDTVNYFLNLAATGIINRTDASRSYVFNNQLRANAKKNNVSLNSGLSWIYGELNRQLSNNDFSAAVDFGYRKDSSRFEYWALGTFEKSVSLNINSRYQYGGGISYDFIKRGDDRLNLSNGLLYESSDLHINDSVNDFYHTWRNSLRLKYRFGIKQDLVVLEGTHFLQNSLSNKMDYIIKSNSSLSVRIYRWVSFTSAVTYNKLNRLKRDNLLITFGVSFQKYF